VPAYPCAQCRNQVDLRDLTCRGCGSKTPFKCSKCEVNMGTFDIFAVDTITFQRPLFCGKCGKETERIACKHCGADVTRRDAVEEDDLIFHPDCFKTRQLQAKVSKGLMVALIPLGAWMGWSLLGFHVNYYMGFIGLPLGGFAGWFFASLLAPKK